jgi:hypothetical protein
VPRERSEKGIIITTGVGWGGEHTGLRRRLMLFG